MNCSREAVKKAPKIYCEKRTSALTEISHHAHDEYWEIVLQLSGEYTATVDNKSYHIRPGDIQVIPPHIVHGGEMITPFKDAFARIPSLDFSGFLLLHDDDGSVKTLLDMIHKAQTEQEFLWEEITEKLTETLVAYVTKLAKTERKYPFVHEVKNLIYENLSNSSFSISDAVTDAGFHPDYFRRCFKEEFGVSPIVYATNLRIEHAKKLLTLSIEYSIVEIAERCGFHDSFYFSKCFKTHTGLSPSGYRKKYRH